MATKIPVNILEQISASNITNNSNVAGATIKDAVEQLDSDKDLVDGFNYSLAYAPSTNTNPNAVGDTWINTATGEIFVCKDNTTNANVWVGTGGTTID